MQDKNLLKFFLIVQQPKTEEKKLFAAATR